jgi:hypothetical protein
MRMLRTLFPLLAVALALVAWPQARGFGSSLYTPVVTPNVDVTLGGQVQGISGDGGAQLAITPGNIQWPPSATVSLAQTAPASDLATNALTIQSEAPFSGASTHVVPGNIVFNTPAPISGTNTGYVDFQSGGTNLLQVGGYQGATNYVQLWPGNVTPSTTNYFLLVQNDDTNTWLNSTSTIELKISGNIEETLTTTAHSFNVPLQGASGLPLAQTISTVGLFDAGGGTVVLSAAQQQTPIIKIGTVSLTGNAVLELGAACPAGSIFDIDATGVTLNAHTLTIQNGAGTFVISGTLGTSTTGPLTRCYTPTTATVVCE